MYMCTKKLTNLDAKGAKTSSDTYRLLQTLSPMTNQKDSDRRQYKENQIWPIEFVVQHGCGKKVTKHHAENDQ